MIGLTTVDFSYDIDLPATGGSKTTQTHLFGPIDLVQGALHQL